MSIAPVALHRAAMHRAAMHRAAMHRAAMRALALLLTSALSMAHARPASAQETVPSLSLGFGVDTVSADVRGIVRTLRDYFALPQPSRTPTPLWNGEEQRGRRVYDATGEAYQGFPATIIEVVPESPDNDLYVVRTLFARYDSASRAIRPLAVQRLYARRTGDRWTLESALPHLTARWSTLRVGRITFHRPPGERIDRARARRTAQLFDDLQLRFAIADTSTLDYYACGSTREMYRIVGLDFMVAPSGPGTGRGGRASAEQHLLLAGDSLQGEAYIHELAHIAFWPTLPAGGRHHMVEEGVATWIGGSRGASIDSLAVILARYQATHPGVTLRMLVDGDVAGVWGQPETDAMYATAGVIAAAIHERGGDSGIRRYLGVTDDSASFWREMPALLGVSGDSLEGWWRGEAARRVARRPLPAAPSRRGARSR
ncbi:MAG: hypothetical protein IT359_13580 [Gemmatimonadaceae bacterium]|nr:hypothetical protein [Gemmatimonadaceae bacterium]